MSHSTNLFAEPFKSSDVVLESFVMMNADVPICSFCMTESFEIVGVAPLFDHGMSLGWTYVSRIDGGLESYIERANRDSSYIALGADSFVGIGRKAIKHIDSSKVEALLNFRAESKPGFELHEPCVEFVSRLVQHQAREILR